MCVNAKRVFTNSRCISKLHPQRLYQTFKCGYCSECVIQQKNEWRVRSYYEAKRCFSKNGFILFDTLTYSDDKISWFHDIFPPALHNCWDFLCFNRRDINLFLKRLRRSLESAGYKVANNLRYLLTSEYGGQNTKRSHYHILFFVTIPDIAAVDFSRYVSRAWRCGFTDGVAPGCFRCPVKNYCSGLCLYKSSYYVMSQRVIVNNGIHKAVNYVTKYISKDLYSYGKLLKRVFRSFTLAHPNWQNDEDMRLEFRRFKNQVLPFHLQSSGFGDYALSCLDNDKMISENCISIPVNDKRVVLSIQLPRYYKRKLLFDSIYFNEQTIWHPKRTYFEYAEKVMDKAVNNLSLRYAVVFPDVDKNLLLDVARYVIYERGVYKPFWIVKYSKEELIRSQYCDWYSLSKQDNCWYNVRIMQSHLSHYHEKRPLCRHRYSQRMVSLNNLRGRRKIDKISYVRFMRRFVSDKPLLPFDPPVRCRLWSFNDFLSMLDDSIISNPYYENFIDSYESWSSAVGGIRNYLQIHKDKQDLHYKELGLL